MDKIKHVAWIKHVSTWFCLYQDGSACLDLCPDRNRLLDTIGKDLGEFALDNCQLSKCLALIYVTKY